MTIAELKTITGEDLDIYQQTNGNIIVSFSHGEVRDGAGLLSLHGTGKTLETATKDYARKLRGKVLVFHSFGVDRREYTIPKTLKGY